jgi:hypothetical protein
MMARVLRKFTATGITAFRQLLDEYRRGWNGQPEEGLLDHSSWTQVLSGAIPFEPKPWQSRLEAARDLSSLLEPVRQSGFDTQNPGLWAWLSCACLESVCPAGPDGVRHPGSDYRHIPDGTARNRYRHLLRGPWEVFSPYGYKASHLLVGPVFQESTIYHEITSRRDLISNPSIIELLGLLYFDARKMRVKSGAQSGLNRPGSVKRLVSILMQLDLTYDLHGMDATQILQLLPSEEFEPWLKPREKS